MLSKFCLFKKTDPAPSPLISNGGLAVKDAECSALSLLDLTWQQEEGCKELRQAAGQKFVWLLKKFNYALWGESTAWNSGSLRSVSIYASLTSYKHLFPLWFISPTLVGQSLQRAVPCWLSPAGLASPVSAAGRSTCAISAHAPADISGSLC